MMNFGKRVTKSGKRISCFHGLSWQNRKQYKSNTDKKFFERPSYAYVSPVKFHFDWSCGSGVRWGVPSTPPPPWVKVNVFLRARKNKSQNRSCKIMLPCLIILLSEPRQEEVQEP